MIDILTEIHPLNLHSYLFLMHHSVFQATETNFQVIQYTKWQSLPLFPCSICNHPDEWTYTDEPKEGKSDILQKNKIANKISHHTGSYI